MVHYDESCVADYSPPPTCPKCGSHRTEIVGLTESGRIVVVRCNSCGARSEVEMDDGSEASQPPADVDRMLERQLS
jgi:transcription elongation factor Elf1